MPLPIITFANFDDLETYINTFIIPNAMELIQGDEHNAVENGLLEFIRQSPLNWQTARIESAGGAVNAARPVNIFMTTTPTSLTWGDNIYNEYVFINTTIGAIPSATYYDITLAPVTNIPARSIVNIVKASNGLWVVGGSTSGGGGGGGAALPPLIGIVDGGGATDPVSGVSTFQNDFLIGLGATNNGRIQIFIDDTSMTNFGINQNIDFDPVTGTIDLNYNFSGNTWQSGSGLYVNRNQ